MTTDKDSCNIITDLLVAKGVEHVVVSPGSRNTPLIIAIARNSRLKKTIVVDERSAAFVALGIAEIEQKPVAVVCTSGTAVLNYSPAIAEAYYRNIPLIVITADRPDCWIDQNDSQTIRQVGVYGNFIKKSFTVSAEVDSELARRVVERTVNDAIISATSGQTGPVHINVSVSEPLNSMSERDGATTAVIEMIEPSPQIALPVIRQLASQITSPRRVIILGGNYKPSQQLNRALTRLAKFDNIVVMCENLTNLHGDCFIDCIDSTLTAISHDERMALKPDVVISFGGAQISSMLKKYLRECHADHWSVGIDGHSVDTYLSLTKRIETPPEYFFSQLVSTLRHVETKCDYASEWLKAMKHGQLLDELYVKQAPWSDLKAIATIMKHIPRGWNLQVSNGMSVRYTQLFQTENVHRTDCNRGVSGIDGSTSTAIGASSVYNGTTLLITGDMSAQYDIGALSLPCISPRFKMIVMCNGGGDIFRFINTTSELPERDEYFATRLNLPLKGLAEAYGFNFYEARDSASLIDAFNAMSNDNDRPSMLAVYTSPDVNAGVMKEYLKRRNIFKS